MTDFFDLGDLPRWTLYDVLVNVCRQTDDPEVLWQAVHWECQFEVSSDTVDIGIQRVYGIRQRVCQNRYAPLELIDFIAKNTEEGTLWFYVIASSQVSPETLAWISQQAQQELSSNPLPEREEFLRKVLYRIDGLP
jgi:hypothetical protein